MGLREGGVAAETRILSRSIVMTSSSLFTFLGSFLVFRLTVCITIHVIVIIIHENHMWNIILIFGVLVVVWNR